MDDEMETFRSVKMKQINSESDDRTLGTAPNETHKPLN